MTRQHLTTLTPYCNQFAEIRLCTRRGVDWNTGEPVTLALGSVAPPVGACNGINFFDYLSDVLNKAADLPHLTPEYCRNLLPDKWSKE